MTLEKDLEVILENKPMLIEVDISNREHVYPMVPSGKSNAEMLGVTLMRRMLTAKLQNSTGSPESFYGEFFLVGKLILSLSQ